jgi:hypothetical protein
MPQAVAALRNCAAEELYEINGLMDCRAVGVGLRDYRMCPATISIKSAPCRDCMERMRSMPMFEGTAISGV